MRAQLLPQLGGLVCRTDRAIQGGGHQFGDSLGGRAGVDGRGAEAGGVKRLSSSVIEKFFQKREFVAAQGIDLIAQHVMTRLIVRSKGKVIVSIIVFGEDDPFAGEFSRTCAP